MGVRILYNIYVADMNHSKKPKMYDWHRLLVQAVMSRGYMPGRGVGVGRGVNTGGGLIRGVDRGVSRGVDRGVGSRQRRRRR